MAPVTSQKLLPGSTAIHPKFSLESVPAVLPIAPPLAQQITIDSQLLALSAMADLGLFFAVILVGFAYVWWRGDLDWVRAVGDSGTGWKVVQL